MAENPAYFTVGPWGYRLLTPLLAHLLPAADEVQAFSWITGASLGLAGGLLFLFLRRLGHSTGAALLAVLAFSLSASVNAAIRNRFLTEPLAVVFELLLLLALQAGSSVPVLGLVMLLGELTKEIFVLFLPAIFLALHERQGTRRALGSTLLAGLPAVFVHLVLRRFWAPYPPLAEASSLAPPALGQALERALSAWPEWWATLGATGLPLALIGACLPEGRAFLRRYGYLAALTVVLPLAVAADVSPGGPKRSAGFLPEDVERLLLYALPFILPLALVALGRIRPLQGPAAAAPAASDRRTSLLAAGAIGVVLVSTLVPLDRYRRVDLRTSRDGPHILALSRESLRFASRLEQGRPVFYELLERRYRPGKDDRRYLERMRWFLLEGFGPMPQYGTGPVALQANQGSFLVPCLEPRDLDVVVTVENAEPLALEARANGQAIGRVSLAPASSNRFTVRAPARTLFRGDNVLTLAILDTDARLLGLRGLAVRPAATP